MHDETGSLDEKLRKKERAEEAVFFGKRDRALVEHLRNLREQTLQRELRELTHMRCPDCAKPLERVTLHGVTVEHRARPVDDRVRAPRAGEARA